MNLEIIRDNAMHGIMMIPILAQYGIKRCNVEGCKNNPTTIITNEDFTAGICEPHYQQAKDAGKWSYRLTFEPSEDTTVYIPALNP